MLVLESRCLGPDASAVRKGRSMSVLINVDNSILAFSAASFSLGIAIRSFETSMPVWTFELVKNVGHDCFVNVCSAELSVAACA